MTVRQLQDLLHYLGYEVEPDGIWGNQTRGAVESFQRDAGLEPDGDPGQRTQQALKEAVAADRFRQKADTGKEGLWKEIRYWTRAEFGCQCAAYRGPYCDGFPVEPDETLVRLADRVRAHFGRPAHRSSGIRCPQHNRDVGGVTNSKHMAGKALDFFVEGVSGQELLRYVQAQEEVSYAYIISGQYVHMDVK